MIHGGIVAGAEGMCERVLAHFVEDLRGQRLSTSEGDPALDQQFLWPHPCLLRMGVVGGGAFRISDRGVRGGGGVEIATLTTTIRREMVKPAKVVQRAERALIVASPSGHVSAQVAGGVVVEIGRMGQVCLEQYRAAATDRRTLALSRVEKSRP